MRKSGKTAQTAPDASARPYFVYVVACADGSLYTGITTDVARRMAEHAQGAGRGAKYTRTHRVVGVRALWTAPDRSAASRLEYRIKRLPRASKDALIAEPERVSELFAGAEGELCPFAPCPVPEDAAKLFEAEAGARSERV